MNSNTKLDTILTEFAELYFKDNKDKVNKAKNPKDIEEMFINSAKESIVSEIRNNLKKEIEEEVRSQIKKEIQEAKDIQNRKQIKRFIIETIVFSFIIGLLVNQFTDIVTYLKQEDTKIWTALVIIGLLLILVLFTFFMYLSNVEELFGILKKKQTTVE